MLRDVRGLALGKLNGEYAERPHIDLVIVLSTALNEFRSHPADCAYLALPTLLLLSKNDGVAEVSELNLSVCLDEDVV